ncbi:hypothetical protein ACU7AI_17920 [Pseudomonas aeruginosa]
MKIRTEHQNLGAALMQIAEDDRFTAINSLRLEGKKVNNAFLINADTCLFLKYRQEPNGTHAEYLFNFSSDVLAAIESAKKHYKKVFLGLVCVEGQEICCIDSLQFDEMVRARAETFGGSEDIYQVLVTMPNGKSLRAYMNAARTRGYVAGDKLIISRSRFPSALFE